MNDDEAEILHKVCQSYKKSFFIKKNEKFNFQKQSNEEEEEEKEEKGNENYQSLCLQVVEIRIMTLKWTMDKIGYLSQFVINDILFTIIDYELDHKQIDNILIRMYNKYVNKLLAGNKSNIIKSFKKFTKKMKKKEKNNKYINNYPLNRRFVGFVDRRRKNENEDKLFWYSPPKNVSSLRGFSNKSKIEDDEYIVPEFYFDLSGKCLLPREQYKCDWQQERNDFNRC